MKLVRFFTPVILASSAVAQSGPSLPASLPQLAAILPSLVHAKTFEPGPFSDAVDMALRKDPVSANEAAAICAKDLEDSDPQVRVWTFTVLYGIATTPEGPSALKVADDQIARILVQGDDTSKRGALLIALSLKQNVPDSFIAPLEHLVQTQAIPGQTRVAAASALVMARPADTGIQQMIVNLINDNSQTRSLRGQLIRFCVSPLAGAIIADNVVRIANTATDKGFRDDAIFAATQIGPAAVARVRVRIEAILKDPTEPDPSRINANMAFALLR